MAASLPGVPLAQAAGVTVQGLSGLVATLNAAGLDKLPPVHAQASFHGTGSSFDGPPLWSLLNASGALTNTPPRALVHEAVRVTGADGYVAVLALGEISPDFEGKQVILADRQDGKPLPDGQWRLVVPGDKRGGRSVRDVTAITIVAP